MENYKIIGGDGREYGAASLEELLAWVGEGRIGMETLVWSRDSEAWSPAGNLPELEEALCRVYATVLKQETPVRAGFLPRAAAYLLDALILTGVFSLVWPLVAGLLNLQSPPSPATDSLAGLFKLIAENPAFFYGQMLCVCLLQMSYQVTLNGRFGATLGKMAVGVRILRMDGNPIGYGLALRRWICEQASSLLFYLGYLLVLVRSDRRALHDLMADTQVVFRK